MNYKNLSNVFDSFQTDNFAEGLISKQEAWDLYEDGSISIKIPEGVENIDEFISSVRSRLYELWGDPDVNYLWEDKDLDIYKSDDNLVIEVADSCK